MLLLCTYGLCPPLMTTVYPVPGVDLGAGPELHSNRNRHSYGRHDPSSRIRLYIYDIYEYIVNPTRSRICTLSRTYAVLIQLRIKRQGLVFLRPDTFESLGNCNYT